MKKQICILISSLLLLGCSFSSSNNSNHSEPTSSESMTSDKNTTQDQQTSNDLSNSSTEDSSQELSSSRSLDSSSLESSSSSQELSSSSSPSSSSLNSSSSSSLEKPDIEEEDILKNPRKFTSYDYTYTNKQGLEGTVVNASLDAFSCEGYASGVTGGGLLSESSENYIKVSTAKELIAALGRKNYYDKNDTDFPTRPTVIEVLNDIDLGWNNLDSETQAFADVISAPHNASTHPILKQTGISVVYITGRQNLTLFSKNGAKLSHACFQIRGGDKKETSNVIIRNLAFDGIWEWDDSGEYDNNDWDQFTIRADKAPVHHIWIDHCTFHKTYDGTIDIKYGATDITISWCSFIPYNKKDDEFMAMMNYLENNRDKFPNYNVARNSGASFDDMIYYASINKKVHLVGHSDNNEGDKNIRVTYCNNYYLDCVERLPRLRLGKVHVYNNIYDASDTEKLKIKVRSLATWPKALGFSENGTQSTNYGYTLMENCYINGINTPLRNNMKKVETQYTGTIEALYTYYTCQNINRTWDYSKQTKTDVIHNGRYTFKGHSTSGERENLLRPFPITPLSFDTQKFKSSLPYEYILYEPELLYVTQNNKVGASAINFTKEQWLSSYYTIESVDGLVLPENGVKGSTTNLNLKRI